MAVALNVVQGKRPSRPENAPKLTDAMWALMESCWDTLPSSRPTADQVFKEILDIEASLSFSLAPDWDQSIFVPIRANVEY